MSVDYADDLRALPALPPAEAIAMFGKLDDAQRLARTNVSPTMVSETGAHGADWKSLVAPRNAVSS